MLQAAEVDLEPERRRDEDGKRDEAGTLTNSAATPTTPTAATTIAATCSGVFNLARSWLGTSATASEISAAASSPSPAQSASRVRGTSARMQPTAPSTAAAWARSG